MILFSVAFAFILVYFTSFLFLTSGLWFISDNLKRFNFPAPLQSIFGYFSGLTVFVSCWRLLEIVLGSAKISFFISLFACATAALLFLKKTPFLKSFNLKQIISLAPLALLIQAFCTTLWSRENAEHAFSTVGSGHSPRFANISLFIVDTDKIPVLGMNYVQSLLSGFPEYFGQRFPLLYLTLWLGLSLFVVGMMTYHLLKWFGLSRAFSVIGSIFVLFGNTALSLSHYLVLDTGSPFAAAGYSDSLHSLGMLIFFSLLISNLWSQSDQILSPKIAILMIANLYASTIMAPQNIFVILALVGLLFLGALFFKPRNQTRIKNFLLVILFIGLSLLAGTRFGGFLTPNHLHETALIAGVQHLTDQKIEVHFDPYIPYHLGNYRGWGAVSPDSSLFVEGESIGIFLEKFTDRILNSVKVMFFPFFGFLLILFFLRSHSALRSLVFLTAMALFCGFVLVWSFGVCDSKWPQARFFMPGVYLGMLCFVLVVAKLKRTSSDILRTLFLAGICVFACSGPYSTAYPVLHDNFTDRVGFKMRLKWLVEYQTAPTEDTMKDIWICRRK